MRRLNIIPLRATARCKGTTRRLKKLWDATILYQYELQEAFETLKFYKGVKGLWDAQRQQDWKFMFDVKALRGTWKLWDAKILYHYEPLEAFEALKVYEMLNDYETKRETLKDNKTKNYCLM